MRERVEKLRTSARVEVDAAGLVAFRILFGLLVAVSAIRFEMHGWVDRFFGEPTFFFHYWALDFVRPLPLPWMHALFVVMAVAGVCIALGAFYRVACVAFFLAFSWVELSDVTNYLNHYYLVSLLALLCAVLPLNASFSVDARLFPSVRRERLPAWNAWLLRFQVGVVYFFAAIAKAQPDWLLHGQPLGIWLGASSDVPVVGPYLDLPGVAIAMSWGGFLYDLTIPLWLSMRRTRPWAYLAVLAFHATVGLIFPIGMFPLIMIVATTVFFDPSWPRPLLARLGRVTSAPSPAPGTALAPWKSALLAAWVVLHVAVPLRAFAYGGDVLWHERGMRFSWRVLVREKNAAVTFHVRARGWRHDRIVTPDTYLTALQEREMGTQPDLIVQLAHHIREDMERRGLEDVEVRADVLASLNGRAMARLLDPDVDLSRIENDPFAPAPWILPAPTDLPPTLAPRRGLFVAGDVR